MTTTSRSAVVLVAAHDDSQRARLVDLVSRSGHRALEAVDGAQAVAVATRTIPDLIIADAALTRGDEVQLSASLEQSPDTMDLPLLVVGAAAPERAAAAGAAVESLDAIGDRMQLMLAQRSAAAAGTVMLRRAMADVRATASATGGEGDGAAAEVRARQIASSVEESAISVLVADDDARYVDANPAACALSGYSRAELLTMTVWDLTPEQRVPQDRRLWERFIRAGRFEGSYRIRRRTGETVTIRCSAAANVAPGLHVSALAPPRLLEVIRS